ncbi:MAG TPA: MarR family winged helix-turn-helix transcriptional regulator [Actinokineospora sp.]|nr:MarR family winged helix-turn-helix transcriptional regulator [Actinokineospora sp.]
MAEHISCLLVKLGQVAFRLAEENLAGLDLRVRHYSILQALADNGAMSQLAVGSYLRIDPATMVTSLDDLEMVGAVRRVRDERDRRRYLVEITAVGLEKVSAANVGLDRFDDSLLADLSDAERVALHGFLVKLSVGPTMPGEFDRVRDQVARRV